MSTGAPSRIQIAHRPLEGILWMILSGISFVCVNGGVHHLGTALPSAESAFIRFLMGLVLLMPALVATLRAGLPRGTLPLVGLRGAFHTLAVILWFFAMARVPVADVTAIGYLSPIVVTAGAALVLGEPIALRRMIAIGVALVGALVVLRPGLRELQPGHIAQVGAAISFGLSYIVAKRLASMLPAGALVALLSLTVTLGLLPFALWSWVTPSLVQLALLAVVAFFATSGHYFMARAFAAAPVPRGSRSRAITVLRDTCPTILPLSVTSSARVSSLSRPITSLIGVSMSVCPVVGVLFGVASIASRAVSTASGFIWLTKSST
jgi:drug/metabolite transporter (DMT)-like permease